MGKSFIIKKKYSHNLYVKHWVKFWGKMLAKVVLRCNMSGRFLFDLGKKKLPQIGDEILKVHLRGKG